MTAGSTALDWRNAYLDQPAAVGLYWCAYENGGTWLGVFIGGRWEHPDGQKGAAEMGRVEFYIDLPKHPFATERARAWHDRIAE